jgi:hypothetical protein
MLKTALPLIVPECSKYAKPDEKIAMRFRAGGAVCANRFDIEKMHIRIFIKVFLGQYIILLLFVPVLK